MKDDPTKFQHLNADLYRLHRALFISCISFAAAMALLIGVRLLLDYREEALLGWVGIGSIPLGALNYYAAKGTGSGKSWGRITSIVIAVLFVFGFPIGTFIAIYMFTKISTEWQSEIRLDPTSD